MTYERFEDLPVWRASVELGVQVYELTADPVFKGNGSLRDQLERAAVSVANNIAEGFERGSTQELLNFLYIARGSAGEVRSMLCFLERLAEQRKRPREQREQGAGVGNRWAEPGAAAHADAGGGFRQADGGFRQAGGGFRQAGDGFRQAGDGPGTGSPLADRPIACERFAGFVALKSQISNLKSLAESVSRQLRGWANSLQNSEIPGQRHLTEKSGRIFRAKREREEFLEHLRQIREGRAGKR
jgi:four helix bundle protein